MRGNLNIFTKSNLFTFLGIYNTMRHLIYILFIVCGTCFAQQKTITGTVTDADSNPFPGVSILINDNTKTVVVTDVDGRYSIKAAVGDQLSFSFYDSKEIRQVGQEDVLDVAITETEAEVISSFYKTISKQSNTIGYPSVDTLPNKSFLESIQFQYDSIYAKPDAEFLKKLQNLPPYYTVGTDPNRSIKMYALTQADKDSIYAAALSGPIVQEAIKAKFEAKSKLYEKGYELEFISVLISDDVSNENKKKLLIGRILADWQYDELHGRPATELPGYINLYNDTTPYQNHNEAYEKFILQHKTISFSRILYVIDVKPYQAKDKKRLKQLLKKLKKTEILYLELLTGSSATAIFGSRGVNGVVVITTN